MLGGRAAQFAQFAAFGGRSLERQALEDLAVGFWCVGHGLDRARGQGQNENGTRVEQAAHVRLDAGKSCRLGPVPQRGGKSIALIVIMFF